jgi:hypothetical protein
MDELLPVLEGTVTIIEVRFAGASKSLLGPGMLKSKEE